LSHSFSRQAQHFIPNTLNRNDFVLNAKILGDFKQREQAEFISRGMIILRKYRNEALSFSLIPSMISP